MTRRIPMLALIAPVLLVLLSACGSDTMSGYQRYEDDKNGFALQYPEDWEQLHGTGALVTFMAPAEPGSPGRPNAASSPAPSPTIPIRARGGAFLSRDPRGPATW